MKWESVPHVSFANARCCDVSDSIRLYVKRANTGARNFTGYINGKWVGSWGSIVVACTNVEAIYEKRSGR